MLCEQGSAASAELDDLFLDATAFDASCGDPDDDPDMVYYDPFDADPGDASKWFLRSTPTLYEDGVEKVQMISEANFRTLEQTPPEASGCSQRK
jgi:hypothetical protein